MTDTNNIKKASVLRESAEALRKTASERDLYRERALEAEAKCAAYETHVRAEKVAAMMQARGINNNLDFETLVSELEKSAEAGKLDVIEQAVSMTREDMTLKQASIRGGDTGGAVDHLTNFLLGTAG